MVHTELDSSTQSDACRTIRTTLLGLAGQRRFITLVVGVTPRSGASFLARNLARSFTFDGSRASLLVDCNLLRPAQHQALGVDPVDGGLVDFLQPEDTSQRGAPAIYPTDVPQLHLLPAGRQCKHHNEEHFSSPRMGDLLGFLQHRYPDRQMFLDGPAVQGSPDAAILGQMADFVVLVVGYGRATPETIRRAALQFPPGKRAGVVFNEMA